MKKVKVKVGDLIFDPKLLEIRPINLFFTNRYRQAMRTGAQFPPIIVEAETNRIISGNHRVSAYLGEYGDDHMVEAIMETFQDEAAVIRMFAEENSRHGSPLSSISQKAIVHALLSYGDTPETIASALNMPVKKIQMLGELQVLVIGKGKKSEYKPIKHGLEHLSGQKMNAKLYDQHRKADRGIPVAQQAHQLCRWIENGWVDMTDPGTVTALEELYAALGKLVEQQAAVG